MTGTPLTSEQALALLTTVIADELNAGHFIDERDIPHVARLREVRDSFAALLARVDALEGALAEAEKERYQWAGMHQELARLDFIGGSPRGEESDTASAACAAPSSPDGAPPAWDPWGCGYGCGPSRDYFMGVNFYSACPVHGGSLGAPGKDTA